MPEWQYSLPSHSNTAKQTNINLHCLSDNIVYQATVIQPNKQTSTYIGQTSCNFKKRLAVHLQTFKDINTSQTALSNHIHELKERGITPKVTWKIVDRGKSFTPITAVCQLCVKEAYYILFKPELATLNSKSEVFLACFHKKSALLIKTKRGRKPHGNKWKILLGYLQPGDNQSSLWTWRLHML